MGLPPFLCKMLYVVVGVMMMMIAQWQFKFWGHINGAFLPPHPYGKCVKVSHPCHGAREGGSKLMMMMMKKKFTYRPNALLVYVTHTRQKSNTQ